jgi:hypothetical protein
VSKEKERKIVDYVGDTPIYESYELTELPECPTVEEGDLEEFQSLFELRLEQEAKAEVINESIKSIKNTMAQYMAKWHLKKIVDPRAVLSYRSQVRFAVDQDVLKLRMAEAGLDVDKINEIVNASLKPTVTEYYEFKRARSSE